MTTLVIGDSIANGIGLEMFSQGRHVRWFARNGEQAGEPMRSHFENALNTLRIIHAKHPGQPVDVFVSAGYNAGNLDELQPMLKALVDEGATVVLSGLKTEWLQKGGSYEQHLAAQTPGRNDALRKLATETGAIFAEDTIAVANGIAGDEIHGEYAKLAVVLKATAQQARADKRAAVQPASVSVPLPTLAAPSHGLSTETLAPVPTIAVGAA